MTGIDINKVGKETRNILKSDRDRAIAVTGSEGTGKSTFVIQLAKAMDPKFSLEKNVIYKMSEIRDKVNSLPRYSAIVLDEAMEAMYKRNWNTKERKQLNIMFSMCRQKNMAFLITIPNFWDLDPYYRNHRVRTWFHIVDRGDVLVFAKDPSPYSADPWYQRSNQEFILKKYNPQKQSQKAMVAIMQKLRNFRFTLSFGDMDPETKREYKAIKKRYFDKHMEQVDDPNKLTKKAAIGIKAVLSLKEKLNMTNKEIAEEFDCSRQYVDNIINDARMLDATS